MKLQTLLGGSAVLGVMCASVGCSAPASDATPINAGPSALSAASGGDWTVVPSPNVGGQDNALASVSGSDPSDVWAVGQFAPDANPNITLTLALHFDGSAWLVSPTPNDGTHANALLGVAANSG